VKQQLQLSSCTVEIAACIYLQVVIASAAPELDSVAQKIVVLHDTATSWLCSA
jgi:hypothetical protein